MSSNFGWWQIVRLGLAHMPQGDAIFPGLTVAQHLDCGAYTRNAWKQRARRKEQLLAIFEPLQKLLKSPVGTLSGGERRMVSLARGLMADAVLYLVDEPSLGLAPRMVDELLAIVQRIAAQGVNVARLARELHDEFGQRLTALRVDAAWLARRAADTPAMQGQVQQVVDGMADQCRQIQRDIRGLLARLQPFGDGRPPAAGEAAAPQPLARLVAQRGRVAQLPEPARRYLVHAIAPGTPRATAGWSASPAAIARQTRAPGPPKETK